MKFDVVIGNPPYQENDNEYGKGSAKPLYNFFIEESFKLQPKVVSLITPSVWFTGGKGLNEFRARMLADTRFKVFHTFETPRDVFPNVSLRGGVNYFIWDKDYNNINNCVRVINQANGIVISDKKRPFKLNGVGIFVQNNGAVSLIEKLIKRVPISDDLDNEQTLSRYVSVRNPFGFTTDFRNDSQFNLTPDKLKKPVRIYASRNAIGYVEDELILRNRDLIESVKVITPFANNIGTDLSDDNLNTLIIENAIVTETYLIIGIGIIKTKIDAINLSRYLRTKFVRALISLAKANQNGTRQTYRFVPIQDFTLTSDIDWAQSISEIDKQLYKKYDLSQEEIDFIESNVKEME